MQLILYLTDGSHRAASPQESAVVDKLHKKSNLKVGTMEVSLYGVYLFQIAVELCCSARLMENKVEIFSGKNPLELCKECIIVVFQL